MAYGTADVIWHLAKQIKLPDWDKSNWIQPPDQDKSNCSCKCNPPDVTLVWPLDIQASSLHQLVHNTNNDNDNNNADNHTLKGDQL